MGFIVEVRCLDTGEEFSLHNYSTITYAIDANSRIRVPQGPAWCDACKTITMAESFPIYIPHSRAQIAEALQNPDSVMAFIFHGQNLPRLSNELDQLEAFLANRGKGAQCLTCGSTRIQLLREEEELLCPDGRVYKIVGCGFADFCIGQEFSIDASGNAIR